jgi:choline kinase
MKAVILSAGQGKRLLPLTASSPKCILPINGQSLLEWQLDELAKCGIEQVTVVVGYEAQQVRQLLLQRNGQQQVRTLYNPAYAVTDNLVSCWTARGEMEDDFVLLNGDTLFEAPIMRRLLDSPARPVTLVTDHKPNYDADDMKVSLDGGRLVNIGKDLASKTVNGESIGMLLFRGEGPALFRAAIEESLRHPSARKKWYLSVIDEMAQSMPVWTCSVDGFQWCEVDYPTDLRLAEEVVKTCANGNDDYEEVASTATSISRVTEYAQYTASSGRGHVLNNGTRGLG